MLGSGSAVDISRYDVRMLMSSYFTGKLRHSDKGTSAASREPGLSIESIIKLRR